MSLRIAIIWQRFGPYHLARLHGANLAFQQEGGACIGIEVAGQDHYAWERSDGDKLTLFENERYEHLPRREIREAVHNCLDEQRPEAVAVNGWSVAEAVAATDWCNRNDRPAILMSETHQGSGRVWKEWVKQRRVSRCDAALVGGRWHADYLASLGFPRERIVIGYDAVDNEHFRVGAEKARGQRAEGRGQKSGVIVEYNLPQNYFYANTRFLPRKNVDGLLRAYAHYRHESPNSSIASRGPQNRAGLKPSNKNNGIHKGSQWDLVISGSGRMEAEWKKLAKTLGIDQYVRWPGFVQYEQLPAYYGLASAFIHPARREAWGLVVNEACAAGLPVIVGDRVGAACELVEQGENGFLVNADDETDLAQTMLRITESRDAELEAMGCRSQQLVARFTPERFGEALWNALTIAHARCEVLESSG